MYHVTKHYPHSLGLSACFRQWRAESHCRLFHGYALAFTLEFMADDLNAQNWVIDFGSLRPIKSWLEHTFDHKLLFASDDPERELIAEMGLRNVAEIREVEAVGCEAFARLTYGYANDFLRSTKRDLVHIIKVTVAEHDGNSASYSEPL